MTNLEYSINKHMIDNFGKSYQYYINSPKTFTDEISPTVFSDVFTRLYMNLYENDLKYQNIEEKFRVALSNDIVALDILSDSYEQIRRVSKGLNLFLDNNRSHNINSSLILQIPEDNDKELESMKTPVILDYSDIVTGVVDARTIIDISTGIQKLYEINYYKKDSNMNRVIEVEYELYAEKDVRYFETSVTFPNFDINSIKFYDSSNMEVVYTDIIIEKLRRKINVYFENPLKIKRLVISYSLNTDDKYISLGNSFVSNKNLYTETLESPITLDKEYSVIEFLDHPTYNYISMNDYSVTMPSLDSYNNKKIKKFHILENADDLKLLLYPIPDNISDVSVFVYNPEYKNIPFITSGANLIIVSAEDIKNSGLITGSKIYIKYTSSESFYEYMELEYVNNSILFRRNGTEKKMTFKIDLAESSSIRNTFSMFEMNYRNSKYKSIVLEKMQDVIEVNVNFPSTTLTRQTITDEFIETNMYAYNTYKHIVGKLSDSYIITLPRKYVAGMIKIYDSNGVEYKCYDWCDNIGLRNNEVELKNVDKYLDLIIYYTPTADNTDVISNINNIKSDSMEIALNDGSVSLNQNLCVVDKWMIENWTQEKGTFKHPYLSSIYYEPFFTNDATISKIYYDENNNLFIDFEEKVETVNLYYHKKKSFNLVVNPAYTMNGYNPLILVSEF